MTFDPFAHEPPYRAPDEPPTPLKPCPRCGQAHDRPIPTCPRDNLLGQEQ